jgi:hypothetical protein
MLWVNKRGLLCKARPIGTVIRHASTGFWAGDVFCRHANNILRNYAKPLHYADCKFGKQNAAASPNTV